MNLSDAQGRLARWRLRLAEFDFKVEYNPGSAQHAADALSRLPGNSHRNVRVAVRAPMSGSNGSTHSGTYIYRPLWDSDQLGLLVQRLPSG
jgi:hypothetical protein